ncbi:hypothetical protein Scep_020768 [Stephania cephalantha]|uniref:RING-type domain-containing protein n=1 Tax=Stephania cephalantha TaxID=152367 RepID=A0AAP0ID55_9MAGN
MENAKSPNSGEPKSTNQNPNSVADPDIGSDESLSRASSRTPFTSLSQVDSDLALARRLQEQERAYMMLRMNGDVSESDAGSFAYEDDAEDDQEEDDNSGIDDDDDEDAFDAQDHVDDDHDVDNIDPSNFNSDEAYARALQEAEEREMAIQLMALTGIHDWHAENSDDQDETNSQDTWEEVDPDELSYEELLALGEVVGTESRGLSRDTIASLPSINYKVPTNQDGNTDQCVVCRLDYEDGETLTLLPCKHSYHPECINNWLQINKVCPVCSAEVSTSESR